WPIFAVAMDEAAHFVDTDGNSAAEPVWRALAPATAQFAGLARIVVCSTPLGQDGFFASLFQQADSGEIADAVAHRATTLEANPTIDAGFLEGERAALGAADFAREYEAEFGAGAGAFFERESVEAALGRYRELPPDGGMAWVVGFDPAFSVDPS